MEKKKWANPTLTKVILIPEEAVLTYCKTASGGGPNQPTGGNPCSHAGCKTVGS
jgi:hypothetical protein